MQFEEFDKKIRDAAEHHYPAYDEQAWGKMHRLLDKHLPEKKDKRRRFILFFLLFFLAGGAGLLYFFRSEKPLQQKEHQTGGDKQFARTIKVIPGNKADTNSPIDSFADKGTKPGTKLRTVSSSSTERPGTEDNIPRSILAEVKGMSAVPAEIKREQPVSVTPDTRTDQSANNEKRDSSWGVDIAGQNKPRVAPGMVVEKNSIPVLEAEAKDSVAQKTVQTSLSDIQPAGTDSSRAANKKKKARKENRFFITLSAGPDASFAASGKPGRVIRVSGAGAGYSFRERLTIRAGFYNADKIYTAGPEAYNPPASFYSYYPFLEKVDASCRVYEIPVGIQYQFGNRKKHGWFAGLSLSAYLMKRETYDYYYKTSSWGSTQHREWTLYNRNNHYFSVLGFSAGYQYRINKTFSLMAEPYLRLPLSGVGYGKVRLNSAGLMFSLAFTPSSLFPVSGKSR